MTNYKQTTIMLSVGVISILFFLYFCITKLDEKRVSTTNPRNYLDSEIITFDDNNFTSYIAQTNQQRSLGLSVFDFLADDEAMIFTSDQDDLQSFWMKDMKFPIDILWLNSQKQIVYIAKNADPADYPETYTSDVPAQYVIELKNGSIEKYVIQIGDMFSWENDL